MSTRSLDLKVVATVQEPIDRDLLHTVDIQGHGIVVGRLEHVDFSQRLAEMIVANLDAMIGRRRHVFRIGHGRFSRCWIAIIRITSRMVVVIARAAALEILDLEILIVPRRLAQSGYYVDDVKVFEQVGVVVLFVGRVRVRVAVGSVALRLEIQPTTSCTTRA